MFSLLAMAAVWRAWLDWIGPWVMIISAPAAMASAIEEFQFPRAASPGREPGAVVPLYEQVGAAQIAPQSVHRLQRRRQMREVQPIMFSGWIHAFFSWSPYTAL